MRSLNGLDKKGDNRRSSPGYGSCSCSSTSKALGHCPSVHSVISSNRLYIQFCPQKFALQPSIARAKGPKRLAGGAYGCWWWFLFPSSRFVEIGVSLSPSPPPLVPIVRDPLRDGTLLFAAPAPTLIDGRRPPMDYDAAAVTDGVDKRGAMASSADVMGAASPPLLRSPIDQVTMWQMRMREIESVESGPFPERPREPDCTYYLRTGLCRFGITCRYNHPPNRQMAIAAARIKGGYPERVGQPECEFYLRTGTCKFGATCKFHHPRDKAGIAGRVQLNVLGYPLRPDEAECAYYMKNGECKFGNTCKFHHPQPNTMVSLCGSTVYPGVHSPTSGQQSYTGGLTNLSLSRASFIASPRWQGLSSYAQVIFPQGLVQVPSWNTFSGQLRSVSSSESQLHMPQTTPFYGTSRQSETTTGVQGMIHSYRSGAIPLGQYVLARDNVFPVRPGQPECEFYLKTGDCKYGAACKFHHPRERLIPIPDCVLSPLGLPLRPEEPICIFYSRYGICKFGTHCKFDHPMAAPMGIYAYSLATSSLADVAVARNLLATSSGPPSFQAPLEVATGKSRRLLFSDSLQIASGDERIKSEGSQATSSTGKLSSF
ncbi:unnamed protein product [Musa acuminata subsp. burmannicoides]